MNLTELIKEAKQKKLQLLDLSGNMLTQLPKEIIELTSLQSLDLGMNQFSTLPEEILHLPNLHTLDLGFNKISSFPTKLNRLKNLKKLYLRGNQLTTISQEIGLLVNLKELYLNDNQIMSLPSEIGQLTNLKWLVLSNNKLTTIPSEIRWLHNLQSIFLNGNPIQSPPVEICTKGINAICNYFESLEKSGEEYLYEAKLVIVGQGGAGKTCLAESLLKPESKIDMEKISTTKGISIKGWKWPYKEEVFRTNIWDFGGQEIYHATHQFFLTKRSLYLFVWDARKDEENIMSFGYWLNIVSLLSEKSPIIMVLNKIDERSTEVDEVSIKSIFNNVVSFNKISCTNGTGINDLIEKIKEIIIDIPLVGTKWPRTWSKIRQILETDKRDYISYKEFLDICASNDLSNQQANHLSSYLHDLGILLHFQEDSILRNIVILKPEWGTDAVYKVLDAPQIKESQGRFVISDLESVWEKYPIEKHSKLLQLMLKFELCFKLIDSNEFIIPEMLPPGRPDFKWCYDNNLVFEYKYEFMPAGIITRFITRNHHLIENNNYWLFGVILSYERQTRALIISNPLERRIKVNINGKEAKSLLAIIRNGFSNIHEALNNLQVKEYIPCICTLCKNSENPSLYDYETLRNYMSKRKNTITCPKSVDDVNLDDLITGFENKESYETSKNCNRITNFNILGGVRVMSNGITHNYGNNIIFGDNAKLDNVKITQCQEFLKEINMQELSLELKQLLQEMNKSAENTEQFIELGKIAEAQKAANESNMSNVVKALKGTGNWVFNMANNIGAKIAADVIKKSIGME